MLFRNLLVFLCLIFAVNQAMADDSKRHQKVDGMNVYLGVVPAQVTHMYMKMHGNADDNAHNYHVVVALFDDKTGERITDAKVKTTVTPLGMSGKTMDMEMMSGDPISYGNYFTMHKPMHHNIKVEIQRVGKKTKSEANFSFERSRD